jgi:hypothetical protein
VRSRRAWKWAVGVFGGMLALVCVIVLEAHLKASATFDWNDREVADKIAAIRARDWTRPPVPGTASPGNAWDLYRKAFASIEAIPREEADFVPEIAGDTPEGEEPEDEVLEAFYAAYQPLLEEIRLAVGSGRVDPAYPYEKGYDSDLTHLSRVIRSTRFLAGAMSLKYRSGHDAEALDLASVGLAMGQDTARGGPLVSRLVEMASVGIVVESVRPLFEDVDLQPSDLERFAVQLDRLENTRLPIKEFVEVEEVLLRAHLHHADWSKFTKSGFVSLGSAPESPVWPSWKLLFSKKLTRAAALSEVATYYHDLLAVCDGPAYSRPEAVSRVANRSRPSDNPLIRDFNRGDERFFKIEATRALDLTLLRVATALAWYEADKGKPPASLNDLVPRYISKVPDCPYTGTPLRYLPGKVWSIGGDLKDDGGVCDERFRGSPDQAGNDVVWWVRRKK